MSSCQLPILFNNILQVMYMRILQFNNSLQKYQNYIIKLYQVQSKIRMRSKDSQYSYSTANFNHNISNGRSTYNQALSSKSKQFTFGEAVSNQSSIQIKVMPSQQGSWLSFGNKDSCADFQLRGSIPNNGSIVYIPPSNLHQFRSTYNEPSTKKQQLNQFVAHSSFASSPKIVKSDLKASRSQVYMKSPKSIQQTQQLESPSNNTANFKYEIPSSAKDSKQAESVVGCCMFR